MCVSVSRDGPIALVQIDNPPVNALSQKVRAGLRDALDVTEADTSVTGVVLFCAGRTFVAGADIKEFNQPPAAPLLPDLLHAIEKASKPWVAALHGTAFGGGLELAMACHARVAATGTLVGLPEVTLGLIPGAGGTVRLVRLVNAGMALKMIAGGKPVSAQVACDAGLIDAIAEEDLIQAATSWARTIAPEPTLGRPIRSFDASEFDKTKAQLAGKSRGQQSVIAAISAVERALSQPAETALAEEREAFLALKASDQSAALRHIFFAERGTLSDPRCKGPTRDLSSIGIVGGGTMGVGIAAACLLSGFPVTLVERDDQAANAARQRVSELLDQSRDRGNLTPAAHAAALEVFDVAVSFDALASADLVIEAVFEDMAVKREVFQELDRATQPRAILATNTSYLDVNVLADCVADPSRVIGLHFFSPAHIMKLLEIVVPDRVADDVIATMAKLSRRLGKIGVLAGVCDGFIANRIMSAYRHEADLLLERGAMPWDIDRAMRDFGFPMGVFEMQDLAGLDISWAMRKRRNANRRDDPSYIAMADRLCENGWFGRKTGQGWYIYREGSPEPSEATVEIIESERARKGISPSVLSDDEVMQRILTRMRQEANQVLADGIAMRSEDIDVVMVNGYGYPRWRGGPLFFRTETQTNAGKLP